MTDSVKELNLDDHELRDDTENLSNTENETDTKSQSDTDVSYSVIGSRGDLVEVKCDTGETVAGLDSSPKSDVNQMINGSDELVWKIE